MISLTPTRLLILVVVVLVIVIYAQYYSKYNNGYNITQTYLDKINLNILYERNPIIIYDSIKTPKQLLKTLFKYSYISKNEYTITTPHIYQSRSKFSFMYHIGQNTEIAMVNLINPIYKNDFKEWRKNIKGVPFSNTSLESTSVEFVSIKLKPFQVLIIPSHWLLQVVNSEEVLKIDLDDVFTYLYFKMIS
jgi:hypothetical protein